MTPRATPRLPPRYRVAATALVASLACAAACLPSVQFQTPPDGGGPDSPFNQDAAADGDAPTPMADGTTDGTTDGGVPGDVGADVPDAPDDVGDASDASDATPPPTLGGFASTKGNSFATYAACVVRSGTLYCWGDNWANSSGQLGSLGTPIQDAAADAFVTPPAPVTNTEGPASAITELAMGETHACALFGSAAYCWGDNSNGQVGNPDSGSGPGEFGVLGLPSDGVNALAAASSTTCAISAIRDAGSVSNVYCWGQDALGQCGRPTSEFKLDTALPLTGNVDGGALGVILDAVAIAAGDAHVCALTSGHKILCWGATDVLQCGPTPGAGPCNGGGTACSPQPLQVPLPKGETPVAIALGDAHSCALTAAGNVFCWGANYANQLGKATKELCTYDTAPDAGTPCSGTPVQIPGLSGIKQLFAGGTDTCALDALHHAYCWGDNSLGQIGDGDSNPVTAPVEMLDPTTLNPFEFEDMALGRYATCARDLGGGVYCWGASVVGWWSETTPQFVF